MKISSDSLSNFSKEVGNEIWGLASIPDDWINKLKVYDGIDLTGQTGLLYTWTQAFYIELLIARVNDLLTKTELEIAEKETLESLLHLTNLLAKNEKHPNEAKDYVSKLITDYIQTSRAEQKRLNLTIHEAFIQILMNTDVYGKIPEKILREYVESKISLFEKQNFRNRLLLVADSKN